MDIKLINERISQLCNQRNWSYYRLAKECGFEQANLKSIVKEKNMPSLYTLEKICNAFGITFSDFFDAEIFNEGSSNPLYISLWRELLPEDKEKVLIYMFGLAGKEIPREFENDV